MKKNVGTIDKVVRIVAAIIIGSLGYYYQSWWGLLAIIPLFTAFVGFCPIWTIFGFSTKSKE
ncbi:MAG: DUF2892 domain-containing protein [Bacteroidales bacterium]|nr:DUF2892 domain-containing protein [Bacteroidales bacterium]MCF6342141.1 DUF2892 domain-containing protein [Bacteroidales bacterium]